MLRVIFFAIMACKVVIKLFNELQFLTGDYGWQELWRYIMRVAILTANTAIYKETEEDKGGKAIKKMVEKAGEQVVFMKAVPNDRKVLSTIMQRMADGNVADLILTTGGAGCGPEDCTPEATMDVADRPVLVMMSLTTRSMLNRCAAGIKGETLIVNLPGKEGAVKAALEYLLPEIQHAVEVIKGEV